MIFLLFTMSLAYSEPYFDFISSGVEKGYTVLVYTKENGEVCKLKMKETQIASNERTIAEWVDYVEGVGCDPRGIDQKDEVNRVDRIYPN